VNSLLFRGHLHRHGQIDRTDQDWEDSSHAAAASALSITINSLSWRLRPDAERFAAPVRIGDRARFLNRPAMMVWTAPDGIDCARMRSLQISNKGDRPWNRLAELVWIRRNIFSSFMG